MFRDCKSLDGEEQSEAQPKENRMIVNSETNWFWIISVLALDAVIFLQNELIHNLGGFLDSSSCWSRKWKVWLGESLSCFNHSWKGEALTMLMISSLLKWDCTWKPLRNFTWCIEGSYPCIYRNFLLFNTNNLGAALATCLFPSAIQSVWTDTWLGTWILVGPFNPVFSLF